MKLIQKSKQVEGVKWDGSEKSRLDLLSLSNTQRDSINNGEILILSNIMRLRLSIGDWLIKENESFLIIGEEEFKKLYEIE